MKEQHLSNKIPHSHTHDKTEVERNQGKLAGLKKGRGNEKGRETR